MTTARTGVYRQIFESSNGFGIPDLLPDMLWEPTSPVQLVVCGYTPLSPDRAAGKLYGYWTEDFRFEALWNKPRTMLDKILRADVAAMVEPDFSVYTDDPFVLQIHNLYRARWVGRYWQEFGVKVVPNVTWSTPDSLDWALLGIPLDAPLIAIEGRPRQRKNWDEWASVVSEVCERLQPRRVLLYGCSAEMAASVPANIIAFSAASPRRQVPIQQRRSEPAT